MVYLEKKSKLWRLTTCFLLVALIVGCGTNKENINYNGGETNDMTSILHVMKVGDKMRFELSLTNETSERVVLLFPSGQQFEIVVRDQNGDEVYRYSEGKMFTMAIVTKEMAPGETLVWEDEWEEAVPGSYLVTGELQIMSMNGESVDREQFIVEKVVNWEK